MHYHILSTMSMTLLMDFKSPMLTLTWTWIYFDMVHKIHIITTIGLFKTPTLRRERVILAILILVNATYYAKISSAPKLHLFRNTGFRRRYFHWFKYLTSLQKDVHICQNLILYDHVTGILHLENVGNVIWKSDIECITSPILYSLMLTSSPIVQFLTFCSGANNKWVSNCNC